MIDKKDFNLMRKELQKFENNRESLINLSRKIIQLSKRIIYSIHRHDLKSVDKLVKEIKQLVKKLPSNNYDTTLRNVALQEYVEAMALYGFYKEKRLYTRKELNVEVENYLMGLCDLTGELVRLAVNQSIRKNNVEAIEIKDFVNELYGEFLKFDLRNGELRKKSDSIKWNLRKLEDLAQKLS
ncbi:haloacid dehalogenase [Candidatus Woesearchaeota archaeon]|nr:MAG: haloacid dehalogenase [Candidatus Woesearchaeota archaeon]